MADFDVAVIGAGPAGYVAAICAARHGLKTALIEKDAAGGLCLNWGCIPSKIYLKDAAIYRGARKLLEAGRLRGELSPGFAELFNYKFKKVAAIRSGLEQLIAANKVELISGLASFVSPDKLRIKSSRKNSELSAKHIVVAVGSKPKILPQLPVDSKRILSCNDVLSLTKLPESMIIVGGGVIGCEFATLFSAFGTKVTILEYMPQLLPGIDSDIAGALLNSFKKRGVAVVLSARVSGSEAAKSGAAVMMENGERYEAEFVFPAVGISAAVDGLGLENVGVRIERGFIPVDPLSYRTNIPNVYAIGDAITFANRLHPGLAHIASCEGEIVAEVLAKGASSWVLDYDNIPFTIFTDPEIGACGFTEEEAARKLAGHELIVQKVPEKIMGIAMALEETDGLTKLIIDKSDFGKIVGAHIFGPTAAERIHVWTAVRRAGESAFHMPHQVMAHPTFSEVFRESLLALDGQAVHVPLMLQSGRRKKS